MMLGCRYCGSSSGWRGWGERQRLCHGRLTHVEYWFDLSVDMIKLCGLGSLVTYQDQSASWDGVKQPVLFKWLGGCRAAAVGSQNCPKVGIRANRSRDAYSDGFVTTRPPASDPLPACISCTY